MPRGEDTYFCVIVVGSSSPRQVVRFTETLSLNLCVRQALGIKEWRYESPGLERCNMVCCGFNWRFGDCVCSLQWDP